jgi:hypothetical protein
MSTLDTSVLTIHPIPPGSLWHEEASLDTPVEHHGSMREYSVSRRVAPSEEAAIPEIRRHLPLWRWISVVGACAFEVAAVWVLFAP